jgi:nucleoside-diphosphate-sugar epimerase
MKGERNIWVFGATGFIGSALVRHLSGDKANRLHLVLNKNTPYRELEGYHTFSGGLSGMDPYWFRRFPPDVVFHLARPAGSNRVGRTIAANRGKKLNTKIIGMLAALPRPPVVVYVSGSLMYGNRTNHEPVFEDAPLYPVSFARFYFQAEKPWLEARASGRLDIRFARPGWIVGPGSWFRKFFWDHFKITGKVPCYGDGSQMMSLIHLDDCASMIDALSWYGTKGQDLNIYTGEPLPQLKFSGILAEMLETDMEFVPFDRLRERHGQTVARALCASIPMETYHGNIQRKADIGYAGVDALLADVIRLLKDE